MKRQWPTLYKTDTTGKIRQWTIRVDVEGGVPYYEVEHGVKDGSLTSSKTEFLQGKNVGRANETTAYQQAELEAESEWNKKKNRKGYHTIITGRAFSPMLAKSYNAAGSDLTKLKDGHHIKFPCYAQPKLDGIRCIAERFSVDEVDLKSRQNKLFSSLPHIQESLSKLDALRDCLVLDGELYTHGEEFQSLTSAIKRDEPSEDSKKVQYHVYDVCDTLNPAWPWQARMKWLEENIKPGFLKIKPVYTKVINDAQELEVFLKDQIRRGYEGIMLRNKMGYYKIGGRSADLQKVKLFMDEEFAIVDAKENKGKMKGQCTFVCETKEGYRFGVKPEGDDTLRRQYWDDWQSGKLPPGSLLTVRFFSWTTSDEPVPRFPVGITIRDYE